MSSDKSICRGDVPQKEPAISRLLASSLAAMWWLLLFALTLSLHFVNPIDSREKLNAMGLLHFFGWHGEDHSVQTEDGYILQLYRLLPPVGYIGAGWKPPVLMMAGLFFRAESWIIQGPEKDLAYLLVEAGFDVWLGEIRGSTNGKGHISLNTTEDTFWEYSWHEMGYYDVPALIDHILDRTGARQVSYIGHSMGTTMFFVTAASRPEYNAKVQIFVAMAPVVFMTGPYGPFLKAIGRNFFKMFELAKKYHVQQLLPALFVQSLPDLCREDSLARQHCLRIINYLIGRGQNSKQFNEPLIPVALAHTSRSNPRTFLHYAQIVNSGRFQRMDFGPTENLQLYGSTKPPDYNLSSVTVPVALYYSTTDALSFEVDVFKLAKTLPQLIRTYKVPERSFNHVDFIWAKDSYNLLFKDIINLMISTKFSWFD